MMTVSKSRNPAFGALAAITAAIVWGFAFITLKWAYAGIGPVWLTEIRFLAAFAMGFPMLFLSPSTRRAVSWTDAWLALPAGIILGACLLLQAAGLAKTSVANSGFITVLYAVFVPIGEIVILRRTVHPRIWLWVAAALVGSVLLTGIRLGSPPMSTSSVNGGDLLTLICAVVASWHFLAVSTIEPRIKSAFATNIWQILWAAVITLPFAVWLESPPGLSAITWPVMGSMAYLVIASTMLGFFLQLKAQQNIPPSAAGLLCLLESPFAAGFAFFLLGESLTPTRLMGAGLMLAAAAGATWRAK